MKVIVLNQHVVLFCIDRWVLKLAEYPIMPEFVISGNAESLSTESI